MSINRLEPGNSSSVYELIEILKGKRPEANLVFEIHDHIEAVSADTEFVNRTRKFYSSFLDSYMVDQWACNNISYIAKVDSLWFVAEHIGANTYLGSGPASVIAFRKHCFENGIRIRYVEGMFEKLLSEITGIKNNKSAINGITEVESYQRVNMIIKRCGEGISRIIKTAQKLIEPNYRDLFLAAINSHDEYIVEGESENRKGRTDLKVIDRKLKCTFIYEFKIYTGPLSVKEGLDQITDKYLTSDNRLNGLVFISHEKRDLSELMADIASECELFGLTFQSNVLDSSEYFAIAKHKFPRNKAIECTLTIFLFDIQK